jgi:hypothetical protein
VKISDPYFINILEQTFDTMDKIICDKIGRNTSFAEVINSSKLISSRLYIKTKNLALMTLFNDTKAKAWNLYYNDINKKFGPTHTVIPWTTVLANFGVRVDKLLDDEYKLIAYNMLDLIKLEYINEKDVIIMFLNIQEKIGIRKVLDFEHFLTLNLIGCKRGLFGVRATVQNRNNCTEQGVFLQLEDDFYRKQIETLQIKVKKQIVTTA